MTKVTKVTGDLWCKNVNVKVNLKCKYNAQDEKVKSEKENFNDATTRKSKEKECM